jgi:hypothetical protein
MGGTRNMYETSKESTKKFNYKPRRKNLDTLSAEGRILIKQDLIVWVILAWLKMACRLGAVFKGIKNP